jgi:glycerol-3-phosphate dehydrogenase
LYHDGQFDDARLAISLAMTAASQGGVLLNYCEVSGLVKAGEKVSGVTGFDKISGTSFSVKARVVINATGVFSDTLMQMDEPGSELIMAPSQGVHIVLDKYFLPGEAAILVPHTDDGRVLFAVPWHDKIIIGTTDTPVQDVTAEPRALPQEIDFILQQISRYLTKPPTHADIRSVFAGLRPLVKRSGRRTAELSRDHLISVSASGLITVTGGKWTTYRRMAEDTVNTAIARAGLPERPCRTAELMIHGGGEAFAEGGEVDFHAPLYYYGSDTPSVQSLAKADPSLGERLHSRLPYIKAEIIWAAREELCMTVEDALSRRTRALLLDAAAAVECAPLVAELLARELGRDGAWQEEQVIAFNELARGYQV